MNAAAPTVITPDIYAELYSKLIVNSCITSMGAICGLYLGQMLRRSQARRIPFWASSARRWTWRMLRA